MPAHRPYPPFDLDCIRTIVTLSREGRVRQEIAEFAKCCYELVGAALAATVGEPQDADPLIGATDPAALDECRAALRQAAEQLLGAAPTAEAEGIDPATITLLVQLLIHLIEKWISRAER